MSLCDGFFPIARRVRPEPGGLKALGVKLASILVIIDDEHERRATLTHWGRPTGALHHGFMTELSVTRREGQSSERATAVSMSQRPGCVRRVADRDVVLPAARARRKVDTMLADFVSANRTSIIARAQARVATRTSPKPSAAEISNGIPVFLDQLCDALRLAEVSDDADHNDLGKSAKRHGGDLLRMGLTVAQVVHDYGDVCQAITTLAMEQEAPIPPGEFRILNLCLDDAIAEAATEFARQREEAILAHGTERLGVLAHEMRNYLNTGMLSFEMIKTGQVAPGGSTARIVDRSFLGLRNLIDRSLAEVRLDAGVEHVQLISVAAFVEEVEIGAFIQAKARALKFTISPPAEPTVTIEGDWQILQGAVANLLQNAFKFTRPNGRVSLTTRVTADRVLFEVEDECGGLPPGTAEELFRPYEQRGSDRGGIGLGLAICHRAAKASGGDLRVRDLPGKGCVFTLDLPRRAPPPLSLVSRESPTVESPVASGETSQPTRTPKADAQ